MLERSWRIDKAAGDGVEFCSDKRQQYQKHDERTALVPGESRSRV